MSTVIHNPDQYMAALRTIIAQGRKRIGLLVGAGAPAGMKDDKGVRPLIPAVAGLTQKVLSTIDPTYGKQVLALKAELKLHDIETIVSRVRALSKVLGPSKVHDLDGDGYQEFGNAICVEIGRSSTSSSQEGCPPTPKSSIGSWGHREIFLSRYLQQIMIYCLKRLSSVQARRTLTGLPVEESHFSTRLPLLVLTSPLVGRGCGSFMAHLAGKRETVERLTNVTRVL
jgi:hypothetical protein